MLAIPRCFERECVHFKGVLQPDGTEMTEVNYCRAFPNGIPDDIAYGENLHLELHPKQTTSYVYEPIFGSKAATAKASVLDAVGPLW